MRLIPCICCGAEMTLDVAIAHERSRAAVMAAFKLPNRLGDALISYIALFRPLKRQLSHDRLASLLEELLPMIQAAQIERNGRTWPAPIEYWRAAIEAMMVKRDTGRLQRPLKSHGYLLEVIAGIASGAEAQAETKREQERAYAYSTERTGNAPGPLGHYLQIGGVSAPMPPETRAMINKILGRRNGDA